MRGFDFDTVALDTEALHRIPRLFWFTFARLFSEGDYSSSYTHCIAIGDLTCSLTPSPIGCIYYLLIYTQ